MSIIFFEKIITMVFPYGFQKILTIVFPYCFSKNSYNDFLQL